MSRYYARRPCRDCGKLCRSNRCWDCYQKTVGPAPRLPYAPLAQFGKPRDIALLTGINPRLLYRWRQDGLVPDTADRVAVALGCHPVEIWPDWYDLEAAS